MTRPTTLVVLPAEEGMRLDVFLAASTDLSRRAARRLITDGEICRNGDPIRVQGRTVGAGDVIVIMQAGRELSPRPLPDMPDPEIVFEDRWLLVASKPAGVLSQPAENSRPTDLGLDQILQIRLALRDGRRSYLRLVHRIDRLTSGAVLFGRNPQAMGPIAKAWESGRVDRIYLAAVEGKPEFEDQEIGNPIERDPDHGWKFRVGDRGRPARTFVRVLDRREDGDAVVACRLDTGRTHQARVHLAALGHPVIGDRLYGCSRPSRAERPLLHAAVLALPHPRTGERHCFVCSPPEDCADYFTNEILATIARGDE